MSSYVDVRCMRCGYVLHLLMHCERKTSVRESCRQHLIHKHAIVRQDEIESALAQMLKPLGLYRESISFSLGCAPDWPESLPAGVKE